MSPPRGRETRGLHHPHRVRSRRVRNRRVDSVVKNRKPSHFVGSVGRRLTARMTSIHAGRCPRYPARCGCPTDAASAACGLADLPYCRLLGRPPAALPLHLRQTGAVVVAHRSHRAVHRLRRLHRGPPSAAHRPVGPRFHRHGVHASRRHPCVPHPLDDGPLDGPADVEAARVLHLRDRLRNRSPGLPANCRETSHRPARHRSGPRHRIR